MPVGKRIDELFAFVSVDKDGTEGVCAAFVRGVWMPLVGADMARVDSLRPIASVVAEESGMTIRLIRFCKREELETITANGENHRI